MKLIRQKNFFYVALITAGYKTCHITNRPNYEHNTIPCFVFFHLMLPSKLKTSEGIPF